MSDTTKNYIYVDAHYENAKNGRRTRWVRMKISDVRRLIVQASGNTNCFTTVQRYKDATPMREVEAKIAAAKAGAIVVEDRTQSSTTPSHEDFAEGQLHYHGVFFDFDAKPDPEGGTEQERLQAAVLRSLVDARKVVSFFKEQHKLPDPFIQCWYSGKKGFHIIVRPEVFGIQPHRHLTAIVKMAILQLKDTLELPTLDTSVYSRGRQWRIPNSIHPGSGLFKVELSAREILDWSVKQIMDLAKAPRLDVPSEDALPHSHIWPASEYRDIQVVDDSVPWWQQFVDLYDVRHDMDRLRPQHVITKPIDGSDDFPACMRDLMDNGMKPTGPNRNRVLLPMAGFMVDAGVEKPEASRMLREWTEKHMAEPAAELPNRLLNATSVVNAAYAGRLHFSCRAIRGNSGKPADEKVACVGAEQCPWINKPSDQDPVQVPTVHLSDSNKGCYIGTKVRIPVHVAALASAPFGIPLKGKIECTPGKAGKLCDECVNGGNGAQGRLQFDFSSEDARVLELIGVNKNEKTAAVRAHCRIPQKCFFNKIIYDEQTNLEEVQLIPMVDYTQIYMEEDTKHGENDVLNTKNAKHVVVRGFHMGHGIQENRKYMIEASVFNFPKDQRVCLLFDKMDLAQNDVDEFQMTPDRMDNLKIFQRRPGQSVKDKLLEIHADFTANVHQIGGRTDMSIAVDLAYHSIIGFQLDSKWVKKGWFELMIVGDTGCGKSTLVDRMISHFGLGELIGGENAKRTGLSYAQVQINGQWSVRWGKLPQNDRRLLVIDEFSGISPEELATMTQIRSDGYVESSGVCSGHRAWARTRTIFLTNPRGSTGQLSDHNNGIRAVQGLFDDMADMRRVDLAIIAEKGEVSSDMVNKRWSGSDVKHYYTADLCHSLVLWAWSREPRHVEWMEGAEERIAHWARELGEVYDCDIPLAYKADLRLKIARIAVATAARVFSTDAEAKKVLVGVDHVDYAANFMDFCYRKKTMNYFEYARKYKEVNNFNDERRAMIKKKLMALGDAETIISLLGDAQFISKPVLADTLNLEKNDMDDLWKFLVSKSLIYRHYKGWKKTPAFNELLKSLSATTTNYYGEFGENFASGESSTPKTKKELEAFDEFYAGPMPTFEDEGGNSNGGEEPPF